MPNGFHFPFFPISSPDPLFPALIGLLALNNPSPGGAWDEPADGRSAAAGWTAICLLPIMSCRSLRFRSFATAVRFACGVVLSAPCRAMRLGCLIALVPTIARFF